MKNKKFNSRVVEVKPRTIKVDNKIRDVEPRTDHLQLNSANLNRMSLTFFSNYFSHPPLRPIPVLRLSSLERDNPRLSVCVSRWCYRFFFCFLSLLSLDYKHTFVHPIVYCILSLMFCILHYYMPWSQDIKLTHWRFTNVFFFLWSGWVRPWCKNIASDKWLWLRILFALYGLYRLNVPNSFYFLGNKTGERRKFLA